MHDRPQIKMALIGAITMSIITILVRNRATFHRVVAAATVGLPAIVVATVGSPAIVYFAHTDILV
jgi:uncharacterized membrane protein